MERIETNYAALAVDSGDVASQDTFVVHGVALGEGDVTIGGSGKQTLWPRETLEEAAEGLKGQPLATDQNHTADDPKAQTPVEAIAGEVTWAGYKPGVGVVYEAEVDDESLAEKIQNGRLEVSPLVSRNLEPLEDEKADFKATEITRWRDLALVANGASPSNEIAPGEAPTAEALHEAIESLQDGIDLTPPEAAQNHAQDVLDWREADDKDVSGMTETGWNRAEQLASGEELSVDDVQEIAAWFARHSSDEYELNEEGMNAWEDNGRVAIKGWGGPAMRDWIQGKRSRLTEMGELEAMAEALKSVAGVTFDGTATGSLDESEIPNDEFEGHYLYPADTKTDSAYPVVDGDENLRKGNVDAAWQLGARGRDEEEHDERLMELAQEFENPPEWAMDDAESMADIADVSEGTLVSWNSSGERDAYGMVEEVREEGDEPFDDEIDGNQTINPPAALITVHTPEEDGWMETDTQVAHTLNSDTLTVVDELPNPESLAMHKMENMADVPEEFVFDNPGSAMSKASDMGFDEIHTHGEGDNTVFMPGATHSALLDELDMGGDDGPEESMAPSNPVNSEPIETMDDITEDELEALEQRREFENPKLVEQDDYEALQDRVAEVRSVMEEALSEKTELKDSTIEALEFEALCAEFEDEEGNLQVEALTQTPESGEPETDPSGVEALSDEKLNKAEALYQDYQTFENEALKADIQDVLEVDDWETATEVLN